MSKYVCCSGFECGCGGELLNPPRERDYDVEAVLLCLDPDYRNHFVDIPQAIQHYQRWAPAEWAAAVRETTA